MWCRVKRARGGRVVGGGNAVKNLNGRGGETISASSDGVRKDDENGGWKENEIQY